MLNIPLPLPRRVAQPVSAAFSVRTSEDEGRPQSSVRTESVTAPPSPVPRQQWSLRTQRVDLPASVTDFWSLEPDVVRFELALTALAAASEAAGGVGFDADSRATLHRAWGDLREAATTGTFVPRARVGAIGVSMACDAAMTTLVAWTEADAARNAFELTGTMLGNVLHQCRTVLVESASQPPMLSAQLMRFVKHLHPLPSERPTAESLAELEAALAELAENHPDPRSRAAFAACLADVTA